MRGVPIEAGWIAGREGCARRGAVGVDVCAQRCGIVRIQQLRERQVDEIRIAEIAGAIAVGAAHRLGGPVNAFGGGLGCQIDIRKDLQGLSQDHAAR